MGSTLAERVIAGDPRAVARAISLIEDESAAGADLVRELYPRTGRAYLIGVTGPPGAGKSTLVDRMTGELRKAGQTVGIVAVDPTSPFSGGAILGDRVRMAAHFGDEGVFIRSMATRGHLGGLARATSDVALVLDAAGKDVVIIETVGVGQDEVDIVRTADVSIVVLVPGTGDEVQALKAGIMEIADVFVVNKADRDGADRLAQSVVAMLSLQAFHPDDWRPPILKTEATTGAGVPEVIAAVDRFRAHSEAEWATRRRERQEYRLRDLLSHRFLQLAEQELAPGEFERLVDGIAARRIDPYSAAAEIINRLRGAGLAPSERSESRGSAEERNTAGGGPAKAVLDHVGIAVQDIDKSLAFFRDALGLDVEVPEDVASQRVRAHFIPVGESSIELLEATASDSAIAKYVEKRGPGIHHITLRVGDIGAVLDQLKARGVRLVDQEPRPGAEGSLVAFIHPSAAHGVLVELKQKGA
ncbi:MAG TPA: methylmalonyl Co-A mutase-associated GTPase MeaB [Vicinamibacterales bacterium]|nr:methylmalonyl Co-A mutase-associated GTPase MeaB [Vicinamibacterales bacterium]